MILLIGAVALIAAVLGVSTTRGRGGRRAWIAVVVAALPLLAVIGSRGDLARYRFSLLALRYRLGPADSLVLSGSEPADLLIPGAGEQPVAALRPVADSALERVVARPRPDAGAVLMVEEERRLGRDVFHLLGAVPLEMGDVIEVADRRVRVGSRADRLGAIPVPWARVHTLTLEPPATEATENGGDDAVAVALPPASGWRRYTLPRRPGVLERSYPLSDVLDLLTPEEGARSGLSSFLFYDDDGRLSLALLDSEIRVGERGPAPLPVWTREGGARRVLVAGLPLRDFPESDLELPERYGVRPMRSYRFGVNDGWLEARPSRPEIHALGHEELRSLDVAAPDPTADEYRIRVSAGRGTMVRQAVVFDTPPARFAAAGQAVFILPRDPSRGTFEVVTPAGFARWRGHHPLSLGDRSRSVLLRVDGQGLSARLLMAYALLVGLSAAVFWLWPMTGRQYAIAVLLVGLGGVRLLLGLSAHAARPFDQEAQQLALWVVPFLPWLVVVSAEVGAAIRAAWHGDAARSAPLTRHAGFAVVLAALAWVLFADSIAKRLVLAALPIGLVCVVLAARALPSALRRAGGVLHRPEPAATLRTALLGPGLRLGGALLGLRLAMAVAGAREQVVVLGTRVGVSVLYTPLSLAALAWILARGARKMAEARGADVDREGARLLVNVGAFVTLAFAGVSALISDYGILFTTLPGALVVLLAAGWVWAGRTTRPGAARALVAAPLVLFLAIQVAPSILHPWGADDARRIEGGMAEWSRNELLLLEREDPQALRLIGQRRSEALAVMRETMRSYTRGNWTGRGFMRGRVSEEVRPTATREHASSALLAAQWGVFGTGGLLLILGGLLIPMGSGVVRRIEPVRPAMRRRRPAPSASEDGAGSGPPAAQFLFGAATLLVVLALLPRPFAFVATLVLALGTLATLLLVLRRRPDPVDRPLTPGSAGSPDHHAGQADGAESTDEAEPHGADPPGLAPLLAAVFLATVAFAGIYMVLANYGWVLFTGKNVYLLGLDSVSDLLESTLLVGTAAAALAFSERDDPPLLRLPRMRRSRALRP